MYYLLILGCRFFQSSPDRWLCARIGDFLDRLLINLMPENQQVSTCSNGSTDQAPLSVLRC